MHLKLQNKTFILEMFSSFEQRELSLCKKVCQKTVLRIGEYIY